SVRHGGRDAPTRNHLSPRRRPPWASAFRRGEEVNLWGGSRMAGVVPLGLVTPPLPEGSGFSLSRLRSVAKGKPCPENVLGRVHVGVRGMPARLAGELGLGDAVLLR